MTSRNAIQGVIFALSVITLKWPCVSADDNGGLVSSEFDASQQEQQPVYREVRAKDFHEDEAPHYKYGYSNVYNKRDRDDGAGYHGHEDEDPPTEDASETSSDSYNYDDYGYGDSESENHYHAGGYNYETKTTTEEPSTTAPPTTTTPPASTPAPEPKKDPYERVGSYIDGLAIFLIPWMVVLCIGLLLPWIESLARRRSLSDNYTFQLDQLSDLLANSIDNYECVKWFKCQSENAILRRTWGRPALRLAEKILPATASSWASTLNSRGESSCDSYSCANFGTNF